MRGREGERDRERNINKRWGGGGWIKVSTVVVQLLPPHWVVLGMLITACTVVLLDSEKCSAMKVIGFLLITLEQ